MKAVLLCILVATIAAAMSLTPTQAQVRWTGGPPKTVDASIASQQTAPATEHTTPNNDLAVAAADCLDRPGFSFRRRRAMGLTIRNIRGHVQQMHESGELAGLDRAEIAVAVLERCVAEHPQAFADPALDWDRLLEFIERLLPLILTILTLI